jgi:hypothetical protein
MKALVLSKFAGCVLVGLLAPLAAVNAADANDHIQAQIGGDGVTMPSSSWFTSAGPEGPVRTDFMVDQPRLDGSYGYAEDAPAYGFAYPEEAPAPSAMPAGADGP